jgi:hypothetical protein
MNMEEVKTNGINTQVQSVEIKIARLEERSVAADKAVDLARAALDAYQKANDGWRQAMNDQRSQFVTGDRLMSVAGLAVAIASIISHFWK